MSQTLQVPRIALSCWDWGTVYTHGLTNRAVLKKSKSAAC